MAFTAKDVQCTWNKLTAKDPDDFRKNPRRVWYHNVEAIAVSGDNASGDQGAPREGQEKRERRVDLVAGPLAIAPPPGIAIHAGENHTGEIDLAGEAFRNVHCVLAGEAVGDVDAPGALVDDGAAQN